MNKLFNFAINSFKSTSKNYLVECTVNIQALSKFTKVNCLRKCRIEYKYKFSKQLIKLVNYCVIKFVDKV